MSLPKSGYRHLGGSKPASGSTAAAAAIAANKQEAHVANAEAHLKKICESFILILKASKVSDAQFENSEQALQMRIHASNLVQRSDLLLKLVSELKQTAVFSDFESLNEHADQQTATLEKQCEETNEILTTIAEQAAASLRELEYHYYASVHRNLE